MRAFILCVLASTVFSKNAWVSKKKEEEASTDFARLNSLVKDIQENGPKEDLGDSASSLMEGVFDQWETLMETPEAKALLSDPALMKEAIKSNPMMKAFPGLDAMLESETFSDPEKFQEAMAQGMETFKTASKDVAKEMGNQFQDLLANPDKLEKTLDDVMQAFGGKDALENMFKNEDLMKNIPGLGDMDPEFKKQMDEAQQYLATLMGGGDEANGLPRKKRLELDEHNIEVEIPDAINARV